MKLDAEEKELLESVKRGEWTSPGGSKRERARFSRYAKATFKKDRRLKHPPVEQGPGGDPEAGVGGRLALSDADRQPPAQVRGRTPQV